MSNKSVRDILYILYTINTIYTIYTLYTIYTIDTIYVYMVCISYYIKGGMTIFTSLIYFALIKKSLSS